MILFNFKVKRHRGPISYVRNYSSFSKLKILSITKWQVYNPAFMQSAIWDERIIIITLLLAECQVNYISNNEAMSHNLIITGICLVANNPKESSWNK